MIIAGSLEGFDIALYGKATDPAKVTLPNSVMEIDSGRTAWQGKVLSAQPSEQRSKVEL